VSLHLFRGGLRGGVRSRPRQPIYIQIQPGQALTQQVSLKASSLPPAREPIGGGIRGSVRDARRLTLAQQEQELWSKVVFGSLS